ncbi:hypothetical protein MYXO_02303 [Myxococcaceae bacterium]|jgi:NifU-like protein|nr:hypothetical protein MYXO_02303 [Myxococcaceae bacterium]
MGVSSPRIFAAVRAGGLRSVDEVTKAVRAGGGCGTCHPEIDEILADANGAPYPEALRLENRLVNESEVSNRIESSLDSGVRPVLAERGVRLSGFSSSGLVVRVRLQGERAAEAAGFIESELRRLVCRDFSVEIEEAPSPGDSNRAPD